MSGSNRDLDVPASEVQHQSDPRAMFRHEIETVESLRGHCARAIDDHDFEAVQHIADDAATHWLDGRSACRRLLEGMKETSPLALAARTVLETNYMALLDLFAHAAKTIDVPSMRQRLERARAAIMTANEQALVAGPVTKRDKRV